MGVRGLLVIAQTTNAATREPSAGINGRTISGSPIDPILTCQACGIKGARVRVDLIGGRDNQRPRPERGLTGRGSGGRHMPAVTALGKIIFFVSSSVRFLTRSPACEVART
jgi:hypothetical protein